MSRDREATATAVRLTMERRTELLAYARSILDDHALAEDVFQESLIVAIEKGTGLPTPEDFGRWVREVVRRTALDTLKKHRRTARFMDPAVLAALEPAWQEADGEWGADRQGTLRGCLEKLSAKARRILQERYENRLTGPRLAERVGLTVDSAYATLTRVHRTLEACMRHSAPEQEGTA